MSAINRLSSHKEEASDQGIVATDAMIWTVETMTALAKQGPRAPEASKKILDLHRE